MQRPAGACSALQHGNARFSLDELCLQRRVT
jgi:hypothetical protein